MAEVGFRPDGCRPEDDDILAMVRSNKCICKGKKEPLQSFCRGCYMALPRDVREELWSPWNKGFAEVYNKCTLYLLTQTSRCSNKDTSSRQTSTSNSNKRKKKNSGKRSQDTQESRLVSAQVTSPISDQPTTLDTLPLFAIDSTKLSTSQETTNITEVIRQVSNVDCSTSNWLWDLISKS